MVEDVEDVYSFYVFLFGLDPSIAWDVPASSLKKLAINKLAITNFLNSDD